MSKWRDIRDELPPMDCYVLIHHTLTNWLDSSDQDGVQYDIAKRVPSKIEGNNLRFYLWNTFGPMQYFGQDVDFWMPIKRLSKATKSL